MVNKGKFSIKDVYALIVNNPIKNRMYKQSRWLHDNHYSEKLNSVCHIYTTEPGF